MEQLSPQEQMSRLLTGYWITQAVYVAAKLDLADRLKAGPRTADDLAQATATHLSFDQISGLLLFALLASKGGSGVTGTGFVTLAAILTAIPAIPVQGLALLVGIEKFMSECRALTNVIGNGVATLVVSRWQGELDSAKLREVMSQPSEQATPPAA